MKNLIRGILIGSIFLTISGCMSPVKSGPDTGYVINSIPDHIIKTRKRSISMLVMTPETNPVYNTKRMAFTTSPYQVTYYSHSRWIEAPSGMFSSLITRTLQKTNHFKAIITPPFTGNYDYALRSQINTLLIDYTQRTPVFRLSLQVMLIKASNGRMISSRDFEASVPLPKASPYGAVYAANCAAEQVLAKIATWSVRNTR